jgi:hypothetical protein
MTAPRRAALIAAGILASLVSPALGQPTNASPATCVLHVFSSPLPTAPEKKTAFIRIAGANPDPFYWGNLSQPTQRLADVSDEDIRQALGLGGDYEVVRHTDRVITKDVAKAAPLVQGSSGCHAELAAYDSRFLPGERNKFGGKEEFLVFFEYREYAGSDVPRLEVDDRGFAEANQFKKTLKKDRDAALADLRRASKDLLFDFGRKVARKRSAARGG